MKPTYLTLIAFILTTKAFAMVDLKKQEYKLASILVMEQKQDYFGAVLTAAQSSAEILNQLRVDEVVTSVESKLKEIRNEVVINHYSESTSGSILFGLLSGYAKRSWDSATIITANPEEVDGFSRKISTDFRSMQNTLKNYVQKNETALAYAKAFALKTVQLSTKLSAADRQNLLPMIKTAVQFSQQLRFLGEQNILKCIETNYANRSKSTSSGIGGLLLSFNISASESQVAHTTQSCSGSVNTAEVSESVLVSAKLSRLDLLIWSYQKQLGLLEVVETKAEHYETWGSPSFK